LALFRSVEDGIARHQIPAASAATIIWFFLANDLEKDQMV
jgi:hypothetical protein